MLEKNYILFFKKKKEKEKEKEKKMGYVGNFNKI
jgi:hypothetical protein